MQRILVDVFRNRYVVCLFLSIFKLSLFLLQFLFSFRGSYRQCYDRSIYALGTVTFIRSITGVTNKKNEVQQQSCIFISLLVIRLIVSQLIVKKWHSL